MAKKTTITKTTVIHAVREAEAGRKFERKDHEVGLVLRCQGRSVRWSVKLSLGGKERRWDLGDAKLHEPDWYRALARDARELCKKGIDPADLIRSKTGDAIEGVGSSETREKKATLWTWEECIAEFLNFKIATRAVATADDYRAKLVNEPAWTSLHSKLISDIDDFDIQQVLDRIADRGAFGKVEGCFRIARAMFNWAAQSGQRKKSGVAKGLLADVKPRPRPQVTYKNVAEAQELNQAILPEADELGRMLAIVQSGALPEADALMIELSLRTAQRRSAICPISAEQIEGVLKSDAPTVPNCHLYWSAWVIPPYFMKGRKATRSKPATLAHLVPIPAHLAIRLDEYRQAKEKPSQWYFPAARPRREGQPLKFPFVNPSTLSHLFLEYPGINFASQDMRRAVTSYGQHYLGIEEEQAKLVLDHTEGRNDSVTSKFYDYRERIGEKIEIMAKWNAWLDGLADEARRADPILRDKDQLKAAIEEFRGKKFRAARKNIESESAAEKSYGGARGSGN